MLFTFLMIVFMLLALLVFLLSFKLLVKISWFLGWLRGNAGLVLLLFSFGIAIASYDFRNFSPVSKNNPILTASFQQKSDHEFLVTLAGANGKESEIQIKGDQWRLELDTLNWSNRLKSMGLNQGYRFEQISSRYTNSRHGDNKQVQPLSLRPEPFLGVDVWHVVLLIEDYFPFLAAGRIVPDYLPMVDGAIYELSINLNKVEVTPINSTAKNALEGV